MRMSSGGGATRVRASRVRVSNGIIVVLGLGFRVSFRVSLTFLPVHTLTATDRRAAEC